MPVPQRVRLLFGSLSPSKFGDEISVLLIRDVYPGSWIPDPNFFHPRSRILDQNFLHPGSEIFPSRILDPGCALKNLSILTKKNGFSAIKNIIQVFDPGSRSRIWILTIYLSQIPILDPRSQIQGSKRHRIPDPGSGFATLDISGLLRAVGGSVGY